MKKASWQLFFLITVLCWALPCEARVTDRDFPPATTKRISAHAVFGNCIDSYNPGGQVVREGLRVWHYARDCITQHCGLPLPDFHNIHSAKVTLRAKRHPTGEVETYLSVYASGNGNLVLLDSLGVLDYTYSLEQFRFKPKYTRIKVNLKHRITIVIPGCKTHSYSCYYEAYGEIYVYDREEVGGVPTIPDFLLRIDQDDYPLSTKTMNYGMIDFLHPGKAKNVRLVAECDLVDSSYPCGAQTLFRSCYVEIDPTITIDPDQMVEIDGVEYPANEVYRIVYSEDLLVPDPKTMPGIPLLLLDKETFSPGISLGSSSFANGAPIPVQHSLQGGNLSPPLSWSHAPANTKSFVLIMDDPDAPGGTWDHWIIYDIPAGTTSLAENAGASGSGGLPSGAVHGTNSWGNNYYQGPAPPSGTHRYYFKLYALSVSQLNPSGTNKAAIEAAMAGKIVGQTELMGTYTYSP